MLAATAVAPDWQVEFAWGTSSESPGAQRLATAVDAAGNLSVIGWFSGTVDFDPGPGSHELTSTFANELFVAKYDASGALINAVDIGDFERPLPDTRLAVDDAGAVYVLSGYQGSGTLMNGEALPPEDRSYASAFVAKLDSGLQTMEWASFINLDGDFFTKGFAVDRTGTAVYVAAGTSVGGTFAGVPVTYNGVSASVSQFDAANGAFHWITPLQFYSLFDLEVDAGDSNSIYAGGSRSTNQGQSEKVLHRLNSAGDIVAETVFSTAGSWGDLDAFGGQVYLAGNFSGEATIGPSNLTSHGGADAVVARFDTAADAIVWVTQAGGTGNDSAQQISVDSQGNLFVAGSFEGVAAFGADTLAQSTTADVYFSQLEAANGSFLQNWRYGRADISDLAASNGAAYVTGRFRASSIDFPTGAEPVSESDVHNYIMRFQPAVDPTVPRINGFVASPDPVEKGSPISLAAVGVFDPAARVDSVSFYHDVDGNRRLEPGIDAFLGTGVNGADGWSFEVPTASLPVGDITFLAQAAYDGGLTSLAVSAETLLRLPTTDYVSTDVGLDIRDLSTITSTLYVPDSVNIGDVDVSLTISHTANADLDVYLIHPDGTRIELFTDVGGNSDNFIDTLLDDQADDPITSGSAPFTGRFQPEGTLADLNGKNSAGIWTLEITDDERRDKGTLDAWSLTLAPQMLPAPTFRVDDVSVTEGDSGTVTADFTITRDGDLSQMATVSYSTADDTATAGSDYTAIAPTTLTFDPGVSSVPVSVTVLADTFEESDETFFVNLSNAVGAAIGDPQGVATIVDDDAVVSLETLFVYEISFESKRGGRDWRAAFEIRSDSDGDGQGTSNDTPKAGVAIEVTFAGQTFTGTTDSNGIFRTSWQRNLSSGDYYANVVDLALTDFVWDRLLDLEDDSDGDGNSDDLLQI